jgi:putative transport protein
MNAPFAAAADLLADHAVLLLFALVAAGSALGRVRIGGFALGPAAVLFLALGVSAADHRLALPADIQTLGLVIFTYTVGLDCGPAFVAGLKGRGLRSLAVVAAAVTAAVVVAAGLGRVMQLTAVSVSGMFTGALTNTPALGAVVASTGNAGSDAAASYALAYPIGVLGALVASSVALHRHRRRPTEPPSPLVAFTVEVQVSDLPALGEMEGEVRFTRIAHEGRLSVAEDAMVPRAGDLLTVVGPRDSVEEFIEAVGQRADEHLADDRSLVDMRRMTVTAPAAVGRTIGELDLRDRFGATPTRLRRGDVDMLVRDDTVLEPGDRLRVVAPRSRMKALAGLLGDSEIQLSEIDFVSLGLGMVAGILAGLIVLPGGLTLSIAGGTLVAGLLLGAKGRIGPMTFLLGHQASLTLRQSGTVIFLAAVGSRSGAAFAAAAFSWSGLGIVAAGALVTATAMLVVSWAGRRWGGLDQLSLAGALAGAQTQPAVLAFAEKQAAGEPKVAVGYTALYPAAMILKILAAQILTHL